MKQTPNTGIHAIRPNDGDDEANDTTGEPEEADAVETEEARQDPQDGALSAGQRRQSSDDAMRRERNDPNTESAGKRRG